MDIIRNILISLVFFLSVILAPAAFGKNETRGKELPADATSFSVDVSNVPLSQVLLDISSQTGFKIMIEKDLHDVSVSGKYVDVSIEEFMRRALRGKNISVISDNGQKVVLVRYFGKKSPLGDMLLIGENVQDGPGSVLTQEQLSAIKELHKEQMEEYEKWKADPDSIDPYTGVRLGDLREMHQEQTQNYEEWKNNPDSMDPYMGKSLGAINSQYSEQKQAHDKWRENPESVDSYTGMKLGNLQALHGQQEESYNSWKNNPDSIDPYSGMKLGDLKRMHEQQQKEMDAKWGKK